MFIQCSYGKLVLKFLACFYSDKEKVYDFRFGLTMFNEISDDVFTLEDWKPEWTLAEVYEVKILII